ncbi:lachesin-like isoform X2 [Planococcus citri]|uniref:lachesin-like isoform X2 n=1 Tax=Planococcus citri TaxID=170843 RepID=UPI0031F7892B
MMEKIMLEGIFLTILMVFCSAAVNRGGQKNIPGGMPGGPKFLSRGQTFRVVLGDTLVLPCEVENLSNYVLLWRRGSAVLTAATLMVTRDSRFRLVDGYNLEISDVMPQDAGDYVCQISDGNNPDQIHTVEILVPPSIRTTPSNGQLTARKGGSITLECKASGNPVPSILWSRKDNALPSGEKAVEGFSITLEKVDRHQAGVYQCTASNGVGDPVTVDMQLDVLYPPEIDVERNWIHSGEGFEAQLVCIVHGEPLPEVLWYQDSFLLDPTDRRTMDTRGNKHTLTIRNAQSADFGNYSCQAENNMGKTRKYMELSGRPTPAEFENKGNGRFRDQYNLTWSIESYPPLDEVRLLYRKMNDTHQQPGQWHDIMLHPHCPKSEKNDPKCEMSHLIRGLDPGSSYEAIVQAKNKYGWNEVSDLYQFYTRGHADYDNYLEPDMKDLGLLSSNASSSVKISTGLCWIVVFWLANV